MKSDSRDILIELVKKHGEDIYGDARRCRAFLSDLLDNRLEINVLSTAVSCGVVEDLLSSSTPNLPFAMVSARLSKRLCDDHGIAGDLAIWAVETWAYALGIQSIDQLTTPAAPKTPAQGSTAKQEPSPQQSPTNKQEFATNSAINAVDSHLTLGWVDYDARRYSDAMLSFQRAIDLDPGSAVAHCGLGRCLYGMGEYSNAVRSFSKAIELDHNNTDVHFMLGECFYKTERYSVAAKSYSKVTKLEPNNAAAHFMLGECLYKMERYSEAADSYSEVIDLKPNNADAHMGLGWCSYAQERYT